jgi:adenylate cyclase
MISSSEILRGSILIVDDQQANVVLLERILRGAGYEAIISTTDPRKVLELHKKIRYDLILLDLEMPSDAYSGFQVMEDLKTIEAKSYLPVIVITAHPEHKLRALQAGARDFISKPLDLPEMLARIHNVLELRLIDLAAKDHIATMEKEIEDIKAGRDPLRRGRIETVKE